MFPLRLALAAAAVPFLMSGALAAPPAAAPVASSASASLAIGETWTIASTQLAETRRINVYVPAGLPAGTALPVMVMPDGGMLEDFLHLAGLLQVGAGNGTTRPFLLVGIENTERRRDLTGPTDNPKDRSIAPRVGGSQAYRNFIRAELLPEVARRYRITAERAIVGESLAGLFVLETFALEPDLFDTYIAIDPSLWWNRGQLARRLAAGAPAGPRDKSVYIAASRDGKPDVDVGVLAGAFERAGTGFTYQAWPGESHATVYHPAALTAFRTVLRPQPEKP
jgi:predicted alpha/beta superfamily hydrolase